MEAVKRDLEERTSNKANEIAEQRYGRPFSELSASLQMTTWMDAEREVVREEGFNHRRDGDDHWAELELMRRLGK